MRVLFIGTGEIGVPTLEALLKSEHDLIGVVTQPDKPVGRSQKVEPPPIKKALGDRELAILQPARIKAPDALDGIRELGPDVIVVMAYGQILPGELLEMPKIACINLHASLLPRWRGAAPIQAAIAAGDPVTGITVMYVDEGLDTGDILLQHKIDIAPNETGGSLHDRLAGIAPVALLKALDLLAKGKAPRVPQDDAVATVASKLKREHGRINWNEPAEVIERKIRAFNPWPSAFTTIESRNLKIFSARIIDRSGKAGDIVSKENELVIAASDRALSLLEIQMEGKRRMSAAEFVRGGMRNLR
jgi:methionyl-tRNA formyltransferase